MKKNFEQIPHTADIQIRVYGQTLEELFCNALVGMFQSVGPRADGCTVVNGRLVCDELSQSHIIEVTAHNYESLLVDFLSEALYLSDVYNQAYLAVKIHSLTDQSIRATVQGVQVTGFEVVEIKAVTYHDLHLKQVDGVWQTDIIFDI